MTISSPSLPFATYSLSRENNAIKVPKEVPLELLGPLGCGIQTGAEAVINSLKVKAGSSFAAFGSGAVGLSAIMAAKVAGATTIIAVDVVQSRLNLALELGAMHVINSKETDAVEAIREITNGGVEYALESTGIPAVLRQSVDALGGLAVWGGRRVAPGYPGLVRCERVAHQWEKHPRHLRGRQRAAEVHPRPGTPAHARTLPVRPDGEILTFRQDQRSSGRQRKRHHPQAHSDH